MVEHDTIKLVLECQAFSVGSAGRVTLVAASGGRRVLAVASFHCDQLGRMVVKLRPSRQLRRLLKHGGELQARLVARIRGRTARAPVTIAAG